MLIGAYFIRIECMDIPMLIGAYFIRIRMHGYTYAYRSLFDKNNNAWIYLCL